MKEQFIWKIQKKEKKYMEYVGNAMNLVQEYFGVNFVMPKDLRKILEIGPAEIKILMNSYNNHNLMLYII